MYTAPCVSAMGRHNFKYAATFSALQRLGGWVGLPFLGGVEGLADLKLDRAREGSDVPA